MAASRTNGGPSATNGRVRFLQSSNRGSRERLALISQKSKLAEVIRYALSHWSGLTRFLHDGRIEIDSNTAERSIRPIALNRKNALFAGSDDGGQNWAVIASLVETCKLCGVDPHAYLAHVLTRIVNGHLAHAIDDLLPWAYAKASPLKDASPKTALTEQRGKRRSQAASLSGKALA